MRDHLRTARPFLVLLAIVATGRWTIGARGVPYAEGHHVFSIVTLTMISAVLYGAFTRRWLGYPVTKAMGLGFTLGLCAQAVILTLTLLSYGLDMDTYYNHPRAVKGVMDSAARLPFGEALLARVGGGLVNAISTAIAAAIGWFMGRVLPEARLPVR